MENLDKKYNTYGLLITVSSLLMIISYSEGKYDGWDLVIAFFAFMFSSSFLKNKMSLDWFSAFVASFIAVSSFASIVFVILELNGIMDIRFFHKPFLLGLDGELYFVVFISLLLSIYFKPKNKVSINVDSAQAET